MNSATMCGLYLRINPINRKKNERKKNPINNIKYYIEKTAHKRTFGSGSGANAEIQTWRNGFKYPNGFEHVCQYSMCLSN